VLTRVRLACVLARERACLRARAVCAKRDAGAKRHRRQAPSAAGAKRRRRQAPQAPSAAAWFPTGSSWPERSEGHERSPAGVYICVRSPGGESSQGCIYMYSITRRGRRPLSVYACMCICVYVCVCVRARVRVRAFVRAGAQRQR
jgi:hypothetical protein